MNKIIFSSHDEDKFIEDFDSADLPWSEKELKDEYERQARFDDNCKKVIIDARESRRKQELKRIGHKYGPSKNKLIDFSTTTKQLIIFIIFNCTIIEIYSMIIMAINHDLSALDSLITSVVSETVAFVIYCVKSYLETKSEKQLEFEYTKFNTEHDIQSDAIDDGLKVGGENSEEYITEDIDDEE